jgi:hypothetical protein
VIQVRKPDAPPSVLRNRGPAAAEKLKAAYDADPASYQAGDKTLPISADLYGHDDVVAALTMAQHGKCCFCERRPLGDVEHFRPKGGYKQAAGDPLRRPGYYWLAYEWTNLYFACGPCNQRFKGNVFPLARPEDRAVSHHDDVTREQPLLVDPGTDASVHVSFREEVAYPVNGSALGRTTIELLQLNREDLRESRADQFRRLRVITTELASQRLLAERLAKEGRDVPAEIAGTIRELEGELVRNRVDRAEFASMARAITPL